MARYDGSPDAFAGFRDANRDLNLDRWPDEPPAGSEEDRDDVDSRAEDSRAEDSWDDTGERIVDLRPPSDPADWATSYPSGAYSASFSLDPPASPANAVEQPEPLEPERSEPLPADGRRLTTRTSRPTSPTLTRRPTRRTRATAGTQPRPRSRATWHRPPPNPTGTSRRCPSARRSPAQRA